MVLAARDRKKIVQIRPNSSDIDDVNDRFVFGDFDDGSLDLFEDDDEGGPRNVNRARCPSGAEQAGRGAQVQRTTMILCC